MEECLKREGYHVEYDEAKKEITVEGLIKDAKARIYNKTVELVKRANQLYAHYQ